MIPVAEPDLGKEELEKVKTAVESGWISSQGKFIEEFEKEFADIHEVKHGVTTCNGTAALHLALRALGVSKKDEVIVPTLTFVSVPNAVLYCHAKPVFVDSHPDYWCIDPEKIEEKITEKTKAIIPVHLYGHPSDMDPIQDLAEDYNLFIVEDAAEAHGSEYKNRKVGSFGNISCFSFYGNKTITTGEGGMCLTDDEALAEKMEILKNHGEDEDKKYWYNELGFNYRMTNLQAAVGVAQVKKMNKFVKKKRRIAQQYSKRLKNLTESKKIKLPPEMKWAKNSYWMYSILVEDESKIERDSLIEKLKREKVETRPFFYPAHRMPIHKTKENLPTAERISRKGLNLPSGVTLNERAIEKVAKCLTQFV